MSTMCLSEQQGAVLTGSFGRYWGHRGFWNVLLFCPILKALTECAAWLVTGCGPKAQVSVDSAVVAKRQ